MNASVYFYACEQMIIEERSVCSRDDSGRVLSRYLMLAVGIFGAETWDRLAGRRRVNIAGGM